MAPRRPVGVRVSATLAWVGVVSYSLYVIHLPLLMAWGKLTPELLPGALGAGWTALGAAWVSIALALCLALSAITYRAIELPFLRRKVRFD
jgi:peptidoglycan/LPS O-acetylase OafA/YrhL